MLGFPAHPWWPRQLPRQAAKAKSRTFTKTARDSRSLNDMADQYTALAMGSAVDAGHSPTAGLCATIARMVEELAKVDPAAAHDFTQGLAHMLRTGDASDAMLAAAETFELHMIAVLIAAQPESTRHD